MKAMLNHENLLWFWKDKPVRLCQLAPAQLRVVLNYINLQAKKQNVFWNGVHYTGYKEAIDFLLKQHSHVKPTKQKACLDTSELDSKEVLDRLSDVFPNSKLAKQISKSSKQQSVTNPIQLKQEAS